LSEDYELPLQSLEDTIVGGAADKEEIIGLKTSLEAEVLEILSRLRHR